TMEYLANSPTHPLPERLPPSAPPMPRPPDQFAPTRRVVLAWAVMLGPLLAVWCCRPLLAQKTFNYAQFIALILSWKVASLLCLPPASWARFTPLRLVAYCFWPGMQPRQFRAGEQPDPGAPVPTVAGFVTNALTGAALLWLVPLALPAATPLAVRF